MYRLFFLRFLAIKETEVMWKLELKVSLGVWLKCNHQHEFDAQGNDFAEVENLKIQMIEEITERGKFWKR